MAVEEHLLASSAAELVKQRLVARVECPGHLLTRRDRLGGRQIKQVEIVAPVALLLPETFSV